LSGSTEAKDRDIKFKDYAAHGVGEYWIVDPSREFVEQYILVAREAEGCGQSEAISTERSEQGESYELLIKSNSGRLRSTIITGFEISIRAIFDETENLKALQEIMRGM